MLQTAQLPDATMKNADSEHTLFFVKHFSDKENGQEILIDQFSKTYRGLTPFVNLYVALCVTSLGWCGPRVSAEDVLTKLN